MPDVGEEWTVFLIRFEEAEPRNPVSETAHQPA